jgi:hypothetical protein
MWLSLTRTDLQKPLQDALAMQVTFLLLSKD